MGKSSSKLKKRRTQSIAWSFRFATLSKKMPPDMVTRTSIHPHLDISTWLDTLDLREYEVNFLKFAGVEELMYFNESDIKQLGVRNSAHRARIVSSLVALRDKYQRGNVARQPSNKQMQRYSLAVDAGRNKRDSSDYELLTVSDSKQSKSLGDLLNMDPQIEQDTIALKKALEWELSLDSRDLRSHAWYHGPIPRIRAEEIVQKDGDFLIRDCTSQPGNYVLTCKTKGPVLHFVINKILIQPETVYERVQYQFEDDAYDTVPDLITFYVGSGKAISVASGARIQSPCNRIYSLSFYATKYSTQQFQQMGSGQRGASPLNSPSINNPNFRYTPYAQQQIVTNQYRSPMSSPPRSKRDTPPRLPSKKQRSQSLTPIQQQQHANHQVALHHRLTHEKYCSADGVIQTSNSNSDSTHNNQNGSHHTRRLNSIEKCNSADGVIQNQSTGGLITRSPGDEKSTSADEVIHSNGEQSVPMSRSVCDSGQSGRFSSLPRISATNLRGVLGTSRTSSLNRDSSDPSLSPCPERRNCHGDEDDQSHTPSPPPKPTRNPTLLVRSGPDGCLKEIQMDPHGPLHRVTSYHASGSDSGNGSGDSAQSSAAGDPLEIIQHRGVVIKNPRFMQNSVSSTTLKSFAEVDPIIAEETLMTMEIPTYEQISKFDLENYHTLLLPSVENKPLDNGALNTFRMMLSETGPRLIANHLTRVDIKLILGDLEDKQQKDPLKCPGIELITLEHGRQLRQDLIERTECLKLLVAVTILTCQSDAERAETLNKWIQVAVDTKTALGNLFGFCSIMLGLCMPQIQRLDATWHTLRQKYTDSAFSFEAKLRPTLKSMNDCSNPQAPNTTVPHLLPYILLRDRGIEDILLMTPPSSTLVTSCITPWETNAADFGLSILFAHLESARTFVNNLSMYKRNAQIVMADSCSRLDELLEDAFRTEFHVKFLWGSKGALVTSEDRHAKFEQVLTVMAEKYCYGEIASTG